MLDPNSPFRQARRDVVARVKDAPSLADLLAVLAYHWRLVAATMILFLAGAIAYVATAPRLYTATASLLIDTRKEDPLQKDRPTADAQIETAALESQTQLLTSDAIATAVVRQLGLTRDPEFTQDDSFPVMRAVRDLADRAARLLSPEPERARGGEDLERLVTDRLVQAISAGRSGRSYVVTLSAVSRDPDKAARIANAVASAYSEDQLSFRLAAVDRSASWLKARAAELRQQSLDADRTVQEYKTANKIVDTQRGFVSEQQLNDMNSQLVLARAQVAEKRARLERTRRLGEGDIPDAASAESMANPVIVKLRQQYLDDSRREGELRSRYGADHPAVVALRGNMGELRRSIRDEVQRIAESFQTDYRNAKASEEELEGNLARLVEQTGDTNRERVQLRALETTAQTYRTLFETFLQQYATTLQQQSFPVTSARVITPAKPPLRKSHPRTSLILLGSLVAGFGLGWLGAFARESVRPTLRSARDVEEATGLALLGHLPEIAQRRRRLPWGRRGNPGGAASRLVGQSDPLLQVTRLYPGSRFAVTMKHVQAALDHGHAGGSRVVGVLSAEIGDGKTIIAANLAQLLAKSGRRTVLVDCDIHNPTLTQSTQHAGRGASGPAEAAGRQADFVDHDSGLHFIPATWPRRDRHGPEALCSPAFVELLDDLRRRYELVVLDLPCLDTVTEARAVAAAADGLVVVCAADQTHTDALVRAIDRWDAAGMMRIAGFVLNRARTRERRQVPAKHEPPVLPTAEVRRPNLRAVG